MLHKKVQELRHEKCQMAKAAERERLNYEEQKNQLLQQIHLVCFLLNISLNAVIYGFGLMKEA